MHTQWDVDDIYNAARSFTISVAQHITLDEFAPILLGLNTTQESPSSHDHAPTPAVDVFAALTLSYAQSALGPVDRLLDSDWLPLPSGDLSEVTAAAVCTHDYQQQLLAASNGGLDAMLRGMVLADGAAVDAFMPRGSGSNACSTQPLLTIQVSYTFTFYTRLAVLAVVAVVVVLAVCFSSSSSTYRSA
jgi:Animal haem peroxidase